MDRSPWPSSFRAPSLHALVFLAALVATGCGAPLAGTDNVDVSAQPLSSDLVVNGTFETDLSGWTLGGVKLPIRSTAYAHSGVAALRCGATSGAGQREPKGDSTASQWVDIPTDASSATLTFWAFETTDDRSGDYQEARVFALDGTVIATPFHELSNSRVWTQYTVDLSAYAGQSVKLYFNVHDDGHTDPTSLWIDDVSLTVGSGGVVDGGSGGGTDGGVVDGGSGGGTDGGVVDGGSGGGTDAGTGGHGALGEGEAISIHTTLGLPDTSTTDVNNPNDYLSVKPQYVVSYDSATRDPNWVAWELDSSWIGSTARTDDYRQDDTLPASFPQAANSDYSYSGYDRGHMCDAKDRSDNTTDMSSTFYLSNMVPQAPNNNRGPWLRLEDYARTLATSGEHLFIYAGPIFDSSPATLGADQVAVPIATWKVVVVLDDANPTSASVTTSTRVIAVIVPNDDTRVSQSDDWTMYRTSVDDIENQTGLDLLSDVDTSVQQVVEARVDNL